MKKYFKRSRMLWDNTFGIPEHHTAKRDEDAIEEMERAVHDNRSEPAGSVLSLQYRACGALRKPEASRPITGRL